MLWILGIILVALWLIGVVTHVVFSGLIHILLVVAVILFVVHLMRPKNRTMTK